VYFHVVIIPKIEEEKVGKAIQILIFHFLNIAIIRNLVKSSIAIGYIQCVRKAIYSIIMENMRNFNNDIRSSRSDIANNREISIRHSDINWPGKTDRRIIVGLNVAKDDIRIASSVFLNNLLNKLKIR
jgi:hypothetical protein